MKYNEKQMYLEVERLAMHKATDLYRPFTAMRKRSYLETLDKEWRYLTQKPESVCECKCKCK